MDFESPETADSLLKNGWYHPQFASDVWQLGQLMLESVGGVIPAAQSRLLDSAEYRQEVESGVKATEAPTRRKHLEYLSGCLTSHTDYADEVRTCLQSVVECLSSSVLAACVCVSCNMPCKQLDASAAQ